MAMNEKAMSPQLKSLKKTDLSPFIRMSGVMVPRLLDGFLVKLDKKQKNAFNKVMPVGGEKKIFFHLKDTPTPPIVVGMAHPPKIITMPEGEVRQQKIRGIRLTTNDLQLLDEERTLSNMLRLGWRLKGQILTILGILSMFWPIVRLGPAELRDLRKKANKHFKPLLDIMPKK